jgi:two-component system cell cycle sensor histidine kinase PleC
MSEVTAEMIERGRGPDPRHVAHRRRLAAQVRSTREKLASTGAGSRTFDLELLLQFARARRAALPVMLAMAAGVAVVVAFWASHLAALVWWGAINVAILTIHFMARRILKIPEPKIVLARWRARFVLAECLQGAAWAALVALALEAGELNAHSFLFVVLLLVGAANALTAATIPPVAYIGLAPIAASILGFVGAGPIQSLPLTLVALVAPIYFVYVTRVLYDAHLASLQLRLEKDSLIGELEEATTNSDEARRRAEEASLAKSKFLATMSHELRTPLNAILGFSEVMKDEIFGSHIVPAYKDYSADIHNSGQHLLNLINEILDLSRVEAGRYELREDAISLAHVVEDCRHLVSLRAEKRGISIRQAIETQLPRLWADERAVRQVALNLLTNAIKFTPSGGVITIKVGWTAAGGQYLSIRDTGAGIPAEEIPIVLSSFGRGSTALKNAEEGTGLGLPIVKGLVELHGGTFTLRSEVRVGTEVIVIFPPERVMDALPQMEGDQCAA